MSQDIQVSVDQIERLIARVRRASHVDTRRLMSAVGNQQENAARRRISRTKQAPDGTKWKEWSADYRRAREKGKKKGSLLIDTGELLRRMTHAPDGDEAELVGSPMGYAPFLLFGKDARPFLDTDGGFADPRDRAELGDIVEDFLSHLFV